MTLASHRARSTEFATLAFVGLVAASCRGTGGEEPGPRAWVTTWMAAQQSYDEGLPGSDPSHPLRPPVTLTDATVREIVHVSLGGAAVRLRLSNRFGEAPLTLAAVHVARRAGGAAIEPASDRAVAFDGAPAVTIAAGAEAWSDPVDLQIASASDLVVSAFTRGPTRVATVHLVASQTSWVAPGDQSSAVDLTAGEAMTSTYWAAAVDALAPAPAKVVVAFGDSLTDGAESTLDANQRWPNHLDARFAALPSAGPVSVVNAGIGGNRWLYDFIGPRGLDRFAHDVLDVTGATHAIVLLGINDLGMGKLLAAQTVGADEVEGAIASSVGAAKARGLRVAVATLLPFAGSFYFSDAGESARQSVNAWIRASAGFVPLDFEAAVRDPAHPDALLPAYDAGDHLHLNDAGYRRLGEAVDLGFVAN